MPRARSRPATCGPASPGAWRAPRPRRSGASMACPTPALLSPLRAGRIRRCRAPPRTSPSPTASVGPARTPTPPAATPALAPPRSPAGSMPSRCRWQTSLRMTPCAAPPRRSRACPPCSRAAPSRPGPRPGSATAPLRSPWSRSRIAARRPVCGSAPMPWSAAIPCCLASALPPRSPLPSTPQVTGSRTSPRSRSSRPSRRSPSRCWTAWASRTTIRGSAPTGERSHSVTPGAPAAPSPWCACSAA